MKIYNQYELESVGYTIKNALIERVELRVSAYFNNAVMLQIMFSNCTLGGYNSTSNIGYMIRALVILLKLEKEEGLDLSSIKKVPVRIILKSDSCIGVGHFLEDRFIIYDELAKITKENKI